MADHIQIGDLTPRDQYTLTSETVSLPWTYTFPIFEAADIEVYHDDVRKVLDIDYTVQGAGQSSGGTVTPVAGKEPPAGTELTLVRRIPIERTSDFQESGAFRAKVINDELDIMTACLQQVADDQSRSLQLSTTDAGASVTLPDVDSRKNKALIFAANGDITVSSGNYEEEAAKAAASEAKAQKWAEEAEDVEVETGQYSALHHATKAGASATAAAASDTSAAQHDAKAQKWAEEVEDTEVETGKYSALHHAAKAATSAGDAAASAAAAAASASSNMYSTVLDKTANYTAVPGDDGALIRADTTAGAVTVTLPEISTVSDGYRVAVTYWAGGNTLTVSRSGTDTINGVTSYVLPNQYDVATFVADAETNTWAAVGSGASAGNMASETFTGDGATADFVLAGDPGTAENVAWFENGVRQYPGSDYTLSGTTVTRTTAPATGIKILALYGTTLAIGVPTDGTVSTAKIVDGAVTAAKLANDAKVESLIIACSDETTDLATGTAAVTFRMPYAFTLTAVRASVATAPVGSTITVDMNEGGTSVLSTKLTIDAGEKTSTTAATAAVISDSALADDAEITIDIDQVGSTTAGAGLKVYLIGRQA